MRAVMKSERMRRIALPALALAVLTAAVILCGPAAAAQGDGARTARATFVRDQFLRQALARHMAAASETAVPVGQRATAGKGRAHHPTALSPQGALAVATLASLGAIILVVVAVIAGERRQTARVRAEGQVPAAATGRSLAS
jgi:hypothetical protein